MEIYPMGRIINIAKILIFYCYDIKIILLKYPKWSTDTMQFYQYFDGILVEIEKNNAKIHMES